MAAQVVYADEEPNGLATMLGGLIEGNLALHPQREKLLRPAIIGVVAPDARVAVTFSISRGLVTVSNGAPRKKADLVIKASSDLLVGLSSVPLKLGLPDLRTEAGREVNRRILKGEIKVKGMLLHP
ncbi:MAG: hypothetical protein LC722_02985, partial [Actinobacteria bacterium]|nr:hypothetical protein [Actinomycetota bacterium]